MMGGYWERKHSGMFPHKLQQPAIVFERLVETICCLYEYLLHYSMWVLSTENRLDDRIVEHLTKTYVIFMKPDPR